MSKPFIKIGKRYVGENYKPLIIVEIGINHNGELALAKKIIKTAKKCGAELIKHQTHIPEDEMSNEAKKIIPVHTKQNIFDIISNSSISYKNEKKIQKYVNNLNMIFLSTPFSRAAADRLQAMKVPAFKIGSGECNNYPLIEHICKFKKPIILSTGMNDISSIKKSVKIIEKSKIRYALLHCTNLYPTPNKLLSGVVYLKTVAPLENNEGAIELSLHGYDLPILDESYPKKVHQPNVGDIVLFPSSLFHRTIPFTTDGERCVIAFDLVPEI